MTGTGSLITISEVLPISCRIPEKASSEPIASPSGRAWEVSRNCFRCSICSRTCSRGCIRLFLAPLGPAQQFVNPRPDLLGTIQYEVQFRHMPYAQPLQQFVPDISFRCFNCLQRPVRLFIAANHLNEYSCTLAVRCQQHLSHIAQPDSRIAQLTLDQRSNLILQGLAQSLQMMLFATLLRHFCLCNKKPMRITETLLV